MFIPLPDKSCYHQQHTTNCMTYDIHDTHSWHTWQYFHVGGLNLFCCTAVFLRKLTGFVGRYCNQLGNQSRSNMYDWTAYVQQNLKKFKNRLQLTLLTVCKYTVWFYMDYTELCFKWKLVKYCIMYIILFKEV